MKKKQTTRPLATQRPAEPDQIQDQIWASAVGKKPTVVGVRLDSVCAAKIEALAAQWGCNTSAAMRRLIVDYKEGAALTESKIESLGVILQRVTKTLQLTEELHRAMASE